MPGPGRLWWQLPEAVTEPVAEAVNRFVCGVKDCLDGYVTGEDGRYTVVECETHQARTTHDTVEIARGDQQVIRVQDQWRQHGTQPPPGRSK